MAEKVYQDKLLDYENQEHWWFIGRKKIVFNFIRYLFKKRPLNLLDVGCGTGKVMEGLKEFGEAKGVEMYAPLVADARKRGLAVFEGDANNFCLEETFDIITSLDVLEHIDDDAATIRNLHRHLDPDGYLIITVPALSFLWGPWDVYNKHKRRYGRQELKRKLENGGFDVVKISYFNTLLFPVIVLVKFFFKIYYKIFKNKPTDTDLGVIFFKPVNYICKLIFCAEAPYLKYWNFPIGISLIAIAKRKK